MDLLLMFLTILLWSHLASSQSWKRRSSISLQGGGDYESDDTVKGNELDGSNENEYEYEYEYLSDETAPNSLPDDDETKNISKNQPTDIMSFTFDFYKQMQQFFVQMVENLDYLMDKIEEEEDISQGFHAGDYGNDRQLTKHEDKGHRLVPARANRRSTGREAGCHASSKSKNCCTKESPCKLGGGDCDRDVECEGDLVCGFDNCQNFHPRASKKADCCKIKYDVDGCQENWKNYMKGWNLLINDGNCDCDRDEDCYHDLVCVKDRHQHSASTPRYHRCKPYCRTESCPVSEGFPCDSQEDCKGSRLLCHKQKKSDVKKCTEPDKDCIGSKGQESCCTPDSPCGEGQGACLYDEDCQFKLMCGHRNCQDFNSTAEKNFNCCMKKSVVCGKKSTYKTVKVDWGEAASFKTQKGEKYKSNSNCKVKFELGPYCLQLKFSCSKLKLNYNGKRSCSKQKGDKLVIQAFKKRKIIYCKRKSIVKSSGSLTVKFTSNKKTNSFGAECMIKCYKIAPKLHVSHVKQLVHNDWQY